MKVIFTTNLDAYKTNCFPNDLKSAPRKGDKVEVISTFINYYRNKNLPRSLEVVDVTRAECNVVICELWYSETDLKVAELAGAKTM